jgi:hypothetical protein
MVRFARHASGVCQHLEVDRHRSARLATPVKI